jgi:hypothetical protein
LNSEYTGFISSDILAGQQQHDEMEMMECLVFSEQLQALLVYIQDCLLEAQDSQSVEANRF